MQHFIVFCFNFVYFVDFIFNISVQKKTLDNSANLLEDIKRRGVAQLGSALHSGCRGRRFKSCCSDNKVADSFYKGYATFSFSYQYEKRVYSMKASCIFTYP